jgi:hypothetical protein
MKTTYGTARLSVVLEIGPPLVVWRIVRSDVAEDPVFLDSFRSNYELGSPPRRIENSAAVIHMGISMYLDRDTAVGTAERFPKLGGFLAEVDLADGRGFNYAFTGHRHHLTIWGDPVKLSEATVDVDPVSRGNR